jgi:hypothetical protein
MIEPNSHVNGESPGRFTNRLDLAQADRFLELLDPNANAYTFQSFDDDNERKLGALARVIHASLDDAKPELVVINDEGGGVYVTINETDGKGRRRQNITRPRAVWCEFDNPGPQPSFPLPPSMATETSAGKFHYYFLLNDDGELSFDEFAAIMRCMVEDHGSDKNAKDVSRVLRLPGFYNCKPKYGAPFRVRIVEASGHRYSPAELVAAFPPKPKATHNDPGNGHAEARKGSATGHAAERSEAEIREILNYIPAHNRATWRTVGMGLHDLFGGSSAGEDIWKKWSQGAEDKFNEPDQKRVWNSFNGSGTTFATACSLARDNGADLSEIARRHRAGGTGSGTSASVHEIPLPLVRAMPAAEPFPIEAMGGLARYAEAIAEIVQCPPAMAANSVLAAATLTAQPYVDVVLPIGNGDVRPVSSYFATVGESGERKTAGDKLSMAGVKEHEKALGAIYERDLPAHMNEREAWESERRRILNEKKLPRSQKQQQLDDLGPEPKAPLAPLMVMEEPTYEGLIKLLLVGQPSVGIYTSEGGQLIGGHTMADEAKLRSATGLSRLWDGEDVKRVRAIDGVHIVRGKRLSMHLMVQPGVADVLLADPVLRDQGMLSRILMVAPETRMGTRFHREPNKAALEAVADFKQKVGERLAAPLPLRDGARNELAPRSLRFSSEARAVWIKFANHIEEKLAPGGELESIRGLAAKLPEHAARLAAVMSWWVDNAAMQVGLEAMAGGIELAQHYADEALRLQMAGGVNAEIAEAEKLRVWLQAKWPELCVSIRAIVRFGPGNIRDTKKARQLVAILQEHHWLVVEPGGAEIKGERAKEAWRVVRGGSS